jgi:deoxyribose-phosphate aldolase
VGRFKAGDYKYVFEDIKAVVDACGDIPVKVILETCLLSDEEIVASSVITREVCSTIEYIGRR